MAIIIFAAHAAVQAGTPITAAGAPDPRPGDGVAASAQSAQATHAPTNSPVVDARWSDPAAPISFDFAARAWFARLNGTIHDPRGAASVTIEDDFDLDDSQVVPLLTATARYDALAFVVNGFWSSTDGTSTAPTSGQFGSVSFNSGDALSSSADVWGVAGDVVFTIYRPYAPTRHPWDQPRDDAPASLTADLRWNALVGGHAVNYSQEVTDLTASSSDTLDLSVITPVVGGGVELDVDLRRAMPWLDRLEIAATAGWGPGVESGDSLLFVRADLSLQVVPNLAITGGYRLLNFDAADSGATLSGSLQGLVAGVELRF